MKILEKSPPIDLIRFSPNFEKLTRKRKEGARGQNGKTVTEGHLKLTSDLILSDGHFHIR